MPLNFIHLTDMHLTHPDRTDPNLRVDTQKNLHIAVARIQAISPPPAFIVASGDLTNQGDVASYQLLHDMLETLAIPVIYALGNHDNRTNFRAVFAPGSNKTDAPYYHHIILDGLHIVTLDSSIPDRVSGHICDTQFRFLEQALQDAPELPKLLVIHHPPLITETSLPWENLNQSDTDRLAQTLKGYKLVGLLSGHIHHNRVSHWHGIPVIISNGLNTTIDVLRPSGMQVEAGTGLGNCCLRASGLSVAFVPLTPEPEILGVISQDRLQSFS